MSIRSSFLAGQDSYDIGLRFGIPESMVCVILDLDRKRSPKLMNANSQQKPVPRISRREIAVQTALAFGLTPAEMFSRTSSPRISKPRFAAFLLIRGFYPRTSHAALGRIFGGMDRTTVSHGERRAAALVASDPVYAARVYAARAAIESWRPGAPRPNVVYAPAMREAGA